MRKALLRFAPALGVALVLAGTAPAATDAQIKAGIKAATNYLKSQGWALPLNGGGGHEEGPMALAGIAMIEAGVDPADPVILNIAKMVREQATKQSKTYQLALDIIFLDKLREDV